MKKYLMRFEAVAVGAIGLFSALFLIQTYHYGRRAALFPRIMSLIVLFLILFFIVSRILRILKKKGVSKEEPVRTEGVAKAGQPKGVNWTLTFAGGIGFCILMVLIGFGLATVCYMVTHPYLAGYRRHKFIFVYALAMGAMMVLIGYAFMIPLPKGLLVELIMDRM